MDSVDERARIVRSLAPKIEPEAHNGEVDGVLLTILLMSQNLNQPSRRHTMVRVMRKAVKGCPR